MALPIFAYWSHGCAMYRQQQWTRLADSLDVSIAMAKDVYRKLGAAYGPDMLICTGMKTDGGGGRWNHARPNMGKPKPLQIFDAISADSWAAGELTISEYSALLRSPRNNDDPLTEGPRIPDFSYYLTMQYFAGTDAYRVTVRRDDDEQQDEVPETGEPDTQQQQTPTPDNADTPYWLYRIVPASSPSAEPLEVLAGSFFDFRFPVECLVTVTDERRETPENTVLVPAWNQCTRQETAISALPPFHGQAAIDNFRFTNDFTVPGDGAILLAPELWASHGQTNIEFDALLPPYAPNVGYGRYLDRVRVGVQLYATMGTRYTYGNGEPGGLGYLVADDAVPPIDRFDPADFELRKSYTSRPFLQPDTAALGFGGYSDLRNHGSAVPTRADQGFDALYLEGKMPIANGFKSYPVAPGATSVSFRVFDGSHVQFLNAYAGIKDWTVSARFILTWDVVDAGGPVECHTRTHWFSSYRTVQTKSAGTQAPDTAAPTTYPWDVGFFGDDEPEEEEPEPETPDPPRTPILEVLVVILLGAIAGLLAALALEALGIVAIGAAAAAVTEAAVPVAVAAGGALEAECIALIAEIAAEEAALNAAAAAAAQAAGTEAAAATAAQYAAIRATATAALEQAAQNIARLAGG